MKILKTLAILLWFAVSIALVIIGQLNKGLPWLGIMLIGLAGLLALLFYYNWGHREKRPKKQREQR